MYVDEVLRVGAGRRAQRALSAVCSVLAASVIEPLLGLIHKRLNGQVRNDALTPDNQQSKVPGSTDDSKNSTSAHRENHVQG